jgi:hypothetical protein
MRPSLPPTRHASTSRAQVGPTHADQPRLDRQLLPDDEDAGRAATQLAALIDRKNTVEYEARRHRPEDAEARTKQAQRVMEWARAASSRSNDPHDTVAGAGRGISYLPNIGGIFEVA